MQSEPLQTEDEAVSPHESKPPAGKRGLKQRIVDEVVKFLIAALYLWVVFGVFALHESVVSGKNHIDFHFYGLAVVNALILGKVMLVAGDLHFADWFKDRPLFYPILCKAVAFAILFLVFYFAEEVIVGTVKGKTIRESIPTIGGGSPSDVLFVGIILSIALIPFFAFKRDPNRTFRRSARDRPPRPPLGKRLLAKPASAAESVCSLGRNVRPPKPSG